MLEEGLRDLGIVLRSYEEGQRKTLCPRCSYARKLRNQTEQCLSIKIDNRGATWTCHNCGWEDRLLYKEEVSRNYGSYIPFEHTPLPGNIYKWLQDRGLSMATLDDWGLSWDEKSGSLMFPYREWPLGEVVNVKYRGPQKLFRQSPGGKTTFYGLDKLEAGGDRVIIVEGEIDALSLAECGITNVLSVPNGAPVKISERASDDEPKFLFLKNGRHRLDAFHRVVLAGDNDERGRYNNEEMARRLGYHRAYVVEWPAGCKDANDVLVKHGKEAVIAAIDNAKPYPVPGVYSFDDFGTDLDAFYAEGTTRGASTGYFDLDQFYTVRPGELTIITGAPHQGKSQFVDNLLYNLAVAAQQRFLFVSLEKPLRMHFRTLAQIHIGKPFCWESFGSAAMSGEEARKARMALSQCFRFIDQRKMDVTVDNIVSVAAMLAERWGLNGVVVDPYAYLRRSHDMSETEFVGETLVRLKAAAEKHNFHAWVVAHPYKLIMVEDVNPEPNPYQISGSAHWYNLGDNIMTVTRAEDGVSKIRVWKNRMDGTLGACYLDYDKRTGRYSDRPEGQPLLSI